MEEVTKSAFYVTIPVSILHSNLSAKEMIMCGAIKGLCSTTGSCFAKNDTLASLLGWSEPSVANTLSRLYKIGAVVNIGKFKSRELILDIDYAGFSQNQKNGFSQNQNGFSQNQKNDTYIYTTKNNNGQIGSNDPNCDPIVLDKKEAFNTFWSSYPVRVKKQDTYKKFMQLKDDEVSEILDSLERVVLYYSQKPTEETPFIPAPPHPTTFINGKRWQDDVFLPKKISKGRGVHHNFDEDKFMEMFLHEDPAIYPNGLDKLGEIGMEWDDALEFVDHNPVQDLLDELYSAGVL